MVLSMTVGRRFIGGLYGRAVGRLLVDLHGGVPTELYWQWIDPGALALIGSASFFGGVSRLTMSLAVIMVSSTRRRTRLIVAHSTFVAYLSLHCIYTRLCGFSTLDMP